MRFSYLAAIWLAHMVAGLRSWLIASLAPSGVRVWAFGLQGQSYGIPTMQGGVETIAPYVDEFITFAKDHPELTFFVTKIGCGIAGFSEAEISPLFKNAHGITNIILPRGW